MRKKEETGEMAENGGFEQFIIVHVKYLYLCIGVESRETKNCNSESDFSR